MIRFALTSAVVLGSLLAGFGCQDVEHEILLRNGPLDWAKYANSGKKIFFAISAATATSLFL